MSSSQGQSLTALRRSITRRRNSFFNCYFPECGQNLEPAEDHPAFECPRCSHRYCAEYMESMFNHAIGYDSIWPPRCHDTECDRSITVNDAPDLLSQALRAKIEAKLPEKIAVKKLFCGNPRCTKEGNTFLLDILQLKRRVVVDCKICHTWTCSDCGRSGFHHTGSEWSCDEDDTQKEIQEAHDSFEPGLNSRMEADSIAIEPGIESRAALSAQLMT